MGNHYYFDPDGDDSRTGDSEATAWKSLAKLSGVLLSPGDQIRLRGGATFVGNLDLKDSAGSVQAPIVISSFGEGRATIVSPQLPAIAITKGGFEIGNLVLRGEASEKREDHIGIAMIAVGENGEKFSHLRLESGR